MVSAVRLLYAQGWKNIEIPTIEKWIMKMMESVEMTKLTCLIENDKYFY